MKRYLCACLFFVSCMINPILRDRNIIRLKRKEVEQLYNQLGVENHVQACKRIYNLSSLLKELDVDTVDAARKRVRKLCEHKKKLRELKDRIGGKNYKQVKRRVNRLKDYLAFQESDSVREVFTKQKHVDPSLQQFAQRAGLPRIETNDQVIDDLQQQFALLTNQSEQVQKQLRIEREHKERLRKQLAHIHSVLQSSG